MSNTPSQSGIRIPQAALTFVVLIAVLGALLLASTNIDPKANIRGAFTATPSPTPIPVDPFAALEYVAWTSPDSLIQLEYPKSWTLQPDSQGRPFTYLITPDGTQQISIALVRVPSTVASTAPQDLLKSAFANSAQPPTIRDVQAGGFKGAATHLTQSQQSPSGGPAVSIDNEIWLLSLDAQDVAVIQGISPSENWPKMDVVFQHVVNSIKIDVPNALVALVKAFPVTPQATGAVTAAAATTTSVAPTVVATDSTTPTLALTGAATTVLTTMPTAAATTSGQ